jgi:AraC-like DNA-binding protein
MTRIVPLIRAGGLGPMLQWMERHPGDASRLLEANDIAWVAHAMLEQPVPLLPALGVLCDATRRHGPDLPIRMAAETGIAETGMLGRVTLEAATLGDALRRAADFMQNHCTHEMLDVVMQDDMLRVRDLWALAPDDDETVHAVQQYVAAIVVSLVRVVDAARATQLKVAIRPHPRLGVGHLTRWFGPDVSIAQDGILLIEIPGDLARRPLPKALADGFPKPAPNSQARLRGDGSLAGSVHLLVRSMLPFDVPTIDRVAAYALTSRRSLQRQLSSEGTTFSGILEIERRNLAERHVAAGNGEFARLASDLGYAHAGSLSRAFRRWTGTAPRDRRAR